MKVGINFLSIYLSLQQQYPTGLLVPLLPVTNTIPKEKLSQPVPVEM